MARDRPGYMALESLRRGRGAFELAYMSWFWRLGRSQDHMTRGIGYIVPADDYLWLHKFQTVCPKLPYHHVGTNFGPGFGA